MAYSAQVWTNEPSTSSPLSAARLNIAEGGIQEASDRLDAVEANPLVTATVTTTGAAVGQVVTAATVDGSGNPASFALAERARRSERHSGLPRQPVKVMVPACAAGHGWVTNNTGIASSDLNDTTDFLLGTQAIKVVTTGAAATSGMSKTLAAPVNVADCDVRLWFKFDAHPGLNNLNVQVGNSGLTLSSNVTVYSLGTATDTLGWPIQEGRWNIIDIPQSAFSASGTADWTAIQRIQVQVTDKSGTPVTVRLGGAAFTRRDPAGRFPNGVVSLTFDDTYAGQFTAARPKMDAYGWRGTLFPIIDQVGQAGRLTQAQFDQLVAQGWEVGGHAATTATHTAGYPGLTQSQRRADLAAIRAWMDDCGYPSRAFAWANGTHNAAAEADVAAAGFDLARTSFQPLATVQAPAQPYAVASANVATQSAALNGLIDKTKAGKGWLIITLHDIRDSGGTGNDITPAALDSLLAYLASSGVAVRPVGEVLAALSGTADTTSGVGDEILIPASSLFAANGSPSLFSAGGAGSLTVPAWLLDPTANEALFCTTRIPPGWGTFDVWVRGATNTTGTGDVVLSSAYVRHGIGDDVSQFGTSSSATVAAGGVGIVQETRVATNLPALAAKDLSLRIGRTANNAADTLTVDYAIVSVVLRRVS